MSLTVWEVRLILFLYQTLYKMTPKIAEIGTKLKKGGKIIFHLSYVVI